MVEGVLAGSSHEVFFEVSRGPTGNGIATDESDL
jgi:hypothetical protein